MRLNVRWWRWGLGLRRLGGSVLLAAGLVVGTILAVGLPSGALAAGATYTGNCPDFTTLKGDVEAVGNGEDGTFTFDTTYVCVYSANATSTINVQEGAAVIINGNDKLKIEGGTADDPGDDDLIDVGPGALLTLDGTTLAYGDRAIVAESDFAATPIKVTNSTLIGNNRDGIVSYNAGTIRVEQSTVTQNGWAGVVAFAGNVTITNSTITKNGDEGVYSDFEGTYASDMGGVTVTDSTISNNGDDGVYTYNGDVAITSSSLDGNGNDGAHVDETGSLTAKQSTFRNNDTDGIETDDDEGYQSVVKVEDSTITGNRRYGIHNHIDDGNGSISVTNSVVSDNGKSDPDNDIDSGILADSGDITVTSSIVSGNGDNGIHAEDGNIVVNDSTISGNGIVDTNNTDSIVTYAGVFADEGDATVTNSTISKNLAYGIDAADGSATVVLSTIRGNGIGLTAVHGIDATDGIDLTGSILAGNAVTNCSVAAIDNGYNLSTDDSCQLAPPKSQNNVSDGSLNLLDLDNNGGPSVGAPGAQQVLQTIALGPRSIAVDWVPSDVCSALKYPDGSTITTDERGITRPAGPKCDSGAYEAPAITLSRDPANPNSNGWYKSDVTLTVDYSGLVTDETLDCSGATLNGLPVNAQELNTHGTSSTQLSDGSHTIDCGVTLASEQLGFSYTGPALPLTIKIDTTKPTATITSPSNNAILVVGQSVRAEFSCIDPNASNGATGSGIARPNGCTGSLDASRIRDDSLLDTSVSAIGSHTLQVTATDQAGNTNSQTVHYTVGYEIAHLPGYTNTVRRGYFALIRIAPEDAQGHSYAGRTLKVTTVELEGPDGQTIPFVYSFQFGHFAGISGYQLSINTRNLDRGTWTLKVKIGTSPQLYTVTFTVI